MGDITLMAKNDFKPFATGKGANVTSQPDWEALPALLSGFTAGKASSAQVNKALRQASFIAAALAQYTASKSGQDVLDDGDLSGFIAKMSAAFGKDFQTLDATLTALAGLATGADKLPYFTGNDTAGQTDLTSVGRDIIGKASIADILTYLGIYDASTSQKGLVRLNGGVTDNDNTLAATSAAVKIAYDAAIAAADIAKTKWSAVDSTISQKGIVMLSDNTGVPDSTTAATTTAVNYVLNQAAAAYSLAESKYTAGGATTGKAGLVQLVNSMGGSGSLVMPQAAVTTAIQTYPSLGKGQTLQDLRGTRSIDATYTNSTGFPIAVYVRIAGGTSANLYVHVNGIEFGGGGSIASNTSIATAFFIVPNGATYRVMASGSSIALQAWSELR
ncbi:tail fiber protein [Salmonella enterica]|nr:tail fiber protein [Salmonella enterica]